MNSLEKSVKLTDYFVELPPLKTILLFIVILFAVFSFSLFYLFSYSILESFLFGFGMILFPAFLSIVTAKVLMRKVPVKRIAATVFFGEFIYALTYFLTLSLGTSLGVNILFLGAAVVFILWYLIARIVFVLQWRSLIFATIQLFFHILSLLWWGLFPLAEPLEKIFFKFYLAAFILLALLYGFFLLVNAPMKRRFGVSSVDAVSMFFAQWFYEEKAIEKTFKDIGEEAETYVSLVSFKRKDRIINMVVPYVHFGPFGTLGGSNFSADIPRLLKGETVVFHGTVTHDMNPVTSDEIKKIITACRNILSNPYRNSSFSFSSSKKAECHVSSLSFNDSSMLFLTRAPYTTEDIPFGTGMFLINKAEQFVKNATIIDQHNAETGEVTYVEPHSPEAFRYMDAIEELFGKKVKNIPLKVGFSKCRIESEVMGDAGIKILSFPGITIIVFDSNGIDPDSEKNLRTKLEKKFRRKIILCTTDTHKVNTVRGVLNPLRYSGGLEVRVQKLISESIKDMRPAKVLGKKEKIRINVFGAKQAIEIVSTISAIVAVARIAGPIILLGGTAAALWLLTKI
ncbi:DUF2070 family protein [Candidatus Micrarchaeota archaeon]|nr:DUF2070 family protein [Candidatus Micrarchaeota archaeon]